VSAFIKANSIMGYLTNIPAEAADLPVETEMGSSGYLSH